MKKIITIAIVLSLALVSRTAFAGGREYGDRNQNQNCNTNTPANENTNTQINVNADENRNTNVPNTNVETNTNTVVVTNTPTPVLLVAPEPAVAAPEPAPAVESPQQTEKVVAAVPVPISPNMPIEQPKTLAVTGIEVAWWWHPIGWALMIGGVCWIVLYIISKKKGGV